MGFLNSVHGAVNGCVVKGKCHRSQRKNESPHDTEVNTLKCIFSKSSTYIILLVYLFIIYYITNAN